MSKEKQLKRIETAEKPLLQKFLYKVQKVRRNQFD